MVLVILSLLVSGYFAHSTFTLYSAKNKLYEAQKKLQYLKQQSTDLQREIDYRKTDDYVINEAREKLNYGFEGEEIIIVPRNLNTSEVLSGGSVENDAPITINNSSKSTESGFSTLKMWFEAFF